MCIVHIYVFVSVDMCMYTCGYILVIFHLVYPFPFFCFLFTLSFHFVLTWGTTMKIKLFCPFWAIRAIVYAIHICLQSHFKFNSYTLTFSPVFLFSFFFVLRLISLFGKFLNFHLVYSFLWFVFMAK